MFLENKVSCSDSLSFQCGIHSAIATIPGNSIVVDEVHSIGPYKRDDFMSSHLIAPEFGFFSKLGMVTMAVEPTAQLIVKNMYIYVHIQRHIYIYHNIILYIIKYSHMYIYNIIYIPTIILFFISLNLYIIYPSTWPKTHKVLDQWRSGSSSWGLISIHPRAEQ